MRKVGKSSQPRGAGDFELTDSGRFLGCACDVAAVYDREKVVCGGILVMKLAIIAGSTNRKAWAVAACAKVFLQPVFKRKRADFVLETGAKVHTIKLT